MSRITSLYIKYGNIHSHILLLFQSTTDKYDGVTLCTAPIIYVFKTFFNISTYCVTWDKFNFSENILCLNNHAAGEYF